MASPSAQLRQSISTSHLNHGLNIKTKIRVNNVAAERFVFERHLQNCDKIMNALLFFSVTPLFGSCLHTFITSHSLSQFTQQMPSLADKTHGHISFVP